MGTANFYSKASKVYVLECEEDCEDFFFDDAKLNAKSELRAIGYHIEDRDKYDGNRNFSGIILGHKYETKTYGGVEFGWKVTAYIRSGYYAHANLDYEIEAVIDGSDSGSDSVEITEVIKELQYSLNNNGLAAIIAPKVERYLDTWREQLLSEVDEIFTQQTTPVVRVATFSNGEAVYEKVNKES